MKHGDQQADAQCSRLIDEATAADEVVIAQGAKGVLVGQPVALSERKPIRMGWLKGKIPNVGLDSPFFDPLPEEELRLWNGEGE